MKVSISPLAEQDIEAMGDYILFTFAQQGDPTGSPQYSKS